MNVNDIYWYIRDGMGTDLKIAVPHQEKMIFESERELYRTKTVCKSLGISNEEKKWGSFIPLRTILRVVLERTISIYLIILETRKEEDIK